MQKPGALFHVITVKKLRRYRQTGYIRKPVRGFDTLTAAMAWAMRVCRQVIVRIDLSEIDPDRIHKMPDHHSQFGEAWWVDENVPFEFLEVIYNSVKEVEP